MLRVTYILLGLAIVIGAGIADRNGWFAARPTMVSGVPQSIRNNPGAYRALYRGSPRDVGGK